MMSTFVDIHHHIIYGMDDGPSDFQQTQEMLKNARKDGVCEIVATPHVTPGITPFNKQTFLDRINEAKRFCVANGIQMKISPGAEIFYTDKTVDYLDAGRVPTLAGTRFVLVEFSPRTQYEDILNASNTLLRSGYFPVLAHIERYRCLVFHPSRVYDLKRMLDVRLQINCSAVFSKHPMPAYFCRKLLNDGLVDAIATDAHNTSTRPVCMQRAYDAIEKRYGEDYAESLTDGSMTVL
jgi:protein-tyrosine phosphatase